MNTIHIHVYMPQHKETQFYTMKWYTIEQSMQIINIYKRALFNSIVVML